MASDFEGFVTCDTCDKDITSDACVTPATVTSVTSQQWMPGVVNFASYSEK